MFKRALSLIISFVFLFSFFVSSFSFPVFADSSSGGGGSSRSEEVDDYGDGSSFFDAVKLAFGVMTDGEGGTPAANIPFIGSALDCALTSTGTTTVLNWLCAATGTIFTDTTMEQLNNRTSALFTNNGESIPLIDIMYLGKDGNLYFRDSFLEGFKSSLSQVEYDSGYAQIVPLKKANELYTYIVDHISNPSIISLFSRALSGETNPVIFYTSCDSYSNFTSVKYWQYNSFTQDALYSSLGEISYSNFISKVNGSGSIDVHRFDGAQFTFTYVDSNGFNSSKNTTTSAFSVAGSSSDFLGFSASRYSLIAPEPVTIYRTKAWAEYYLNGGASVISVDSPYSPYGAVNTFDSNYDELQKAYTNLAKDVSDGTKTLDDMSSDLSSLIKVSQDIEDDTGDIVDNTFSIISYLRRILSKLSDIGSKLTYSNVVGTVNAASNLISSIGSVLDDLFNSSDSFSLLDFVSNGISDTMKTVFPFSLSHDMLLIYELLSVEPQVPEINFHFSIDRLGFSYDFSYVADDFQNLAYITRFFSSIGFVILLINLTNKMLKK